MLNKITRCKLALVLYLPERQSSPQSVLRQITNHINYIDVSSGTLTIISKIRFMKRTGQRDEYFVEDHSQHYHIYSK
jgi:hypothetical protein